MLCRALRRCALSGSCQVVPFMQVLYHPFLASNAAWPASAQASHHHPCTWPLTQVQPHVLAPTLAAAARGHKPDQTCSSGPEFSCFVTRHCRPALLHKAAHIPELCWPAAPSCQQKQLAAAQMRPALGAQSVVIDSSSAPACPCSLQGVRTISLLCCSHCWGQHTSETSSDSRFSLALQPAGSTVAH